MPVMQTNFDEDFAKGYAGMDADGELSNIITRTLEGATACAFGRPAYAGVADKGATLAVSADLLGFTLAQKGLPVTADRPADTYAPKDNLAIKNRGMIWVNSTTAANNLQQVYVVTATGAITNSNVDSTAATGWFFEDTIAAPGLTRIVRR